MFQKVYWEISGICNANCPYCITGKKCVGGRSLKDAGMRKVVNIDDFKVSLEHLIKEKVILPMHTTVSLYNWGDPFLHPKFDEILTILSEKKIFYALSTNASVIKVPPPRVLKNCLNVIISMPGYSQDSYDRIHGFNFEVVKRNIITTVLAWRQNGYQGSFDINFHVYQFNIHEIPFIKAFAQELRVKYSLYHATLNGLSLMKMFFNKELSYEKMEKTRSELVTSFYNQIAVEPMKHCSQMDFLTLNEYCEVLPCCGVDRSMPLYSFGDVRSMNENEIRRVKLNASYCVECLNSGLPAMGEQIIKWPVSYYG